MGIIEQTLREAGADLLPDDDPRLQDAVSLRVRRTRAGLSVTRLARLSGLSIARIYDMEDPSGSRIDPKDVERYQLGCSARRRAPAAGLVTKYGSRTAKMSRQPDLALSLRHGRRSRKGADSRLAGPRHGKTKGRTG